MGRCGSRLEEADGDLIVTVDDAPWSEGVVAVEDRVLALGGMVTLGGARLRAVIRLADR